MAELFAKYTCTNCQDDIPGTRVHCAECTSFDLCLQCFASGAEIGTHRNDHAYQFVDNGTGILTIYRGKNAWSAREELRLLDAVEKYGYGNWEDISKHIETRSAEDAKEEYISKYLNGTIGRHTWHPVSEHQRPNLIDHTMEQDEGPLGANNVHKLPPLDITAEEAALLGYMPNRDGFEREYDPGAEQLVSALTLNPSDKEIDVILKLAQLDIYTRRLRERARRKRLVRDYQLAANFFRGAHKASHLTREQREFRDRFRVFAQFLTAFEYERLLASIERERDLRMRLSELYRYRHNGLTSIDDCVHFEQHAALVPFKDTGPYGVGKTDNQPTTGSPLASCSHSLQIVKTEPANANESSCSIGKNPTPRIADPTCFDASLPNKNCLDSCRGSSGQSSLLTTMTPTMPAQAGSSSSNPHHHQTAEQQSANPGDLAADANLNNPNRNPYLAAAAAAQQPQHQTVTQLGENLLSKNEKKLCSTLNLPPSVYLTMKTVLLCDGAVCSSPIEISIRKYLVKAGWLSH